MSPKARFILVIIILTFIPYLILGIVGYRYGRNALRNFVLERVENVNIVKAGHVERFFSELTRQMSDVAKSPGTIDIFPRLSTEAASPRTDSYAQLDAEVDRLIPSPIDLGYIDAHLVKQDGTILYSYRSSDLDEVGTKAAGLMADAVRGGQSGLFFSPVFETGDIEDPFALYAVYPVHDEDGGALGVYQVIVSLKRLFTDISETLGLSSTGETYLGINDGFSVTYLTPLQNDPNAPLTRTVPSEQINHPLALATSGKTGSGDTIDYDNVKVFAAWRPINVVNWGIVTKVNQAEALSIITDIRSKVSLVVLLAAIVLSVVVITVVHVTIDRPLRELARMAEKLARNEDPGRLGSKLLYSHDSVGEIANSLHHIDRHRKRGDAHEADSEDLLEHSH